MKNSKVNKKWYGKLDKGLNDAASTIAAIKWNKELDDNEAIKEPALQRETINTLLK